MISRSSRWKVLKIHLRIRPGGDSHRRAVATLGAALAQDAAVAVACTLILRFDVHRRERRRSATVAGVHERTHSAHSGTPSNHLWHSLCRSVSPAFAARADGRYAFGSTLLADPAPENVAVPDIDESSIGTSYHAYPHDSQSCE